MVQKEEMRKLTLIINAALLAYVVLMIGFYAHYGVSYMVYHSIPTVVAYLAFFYVVYKNLLDLYVWLVYAVITIYMIAATICLGYNYGFHLYCLSLIPLTFYMEYFADKLHTRKANALRMSLVLVCAYLLCAGYTVVKGPSYEINSKVACICMIVNAISTFCFLIGYSSLMHKMVAASEAKLSEMAHLDQLTGLYNRHYMISYLDELKSEITSEQWLAMVDIDNFKGINDHYGHNCGDYVLITLCKIMRDVCSECVIARWGGEEFLIAAKEEGQEPEILEKLRQAVERNHFSYQGNDLAVTITIGTSHYQADQTLDSWIQSADSKLYEGKNSGKNRIIY